MKPAEKKFLARGAAGGTWGTCLGSTSLQHPPEPRNEPPQASLTRATCPGPRCFQERSDPPAHGAGAWKPNHQTAPHNQPGLSDLSPPSSPSPAPALPRLALSRYSLSKVAAQALSPPAPACDTLRCPGRRRAPEQHLARRTQRVRNALPSPSNIRLSITSRPLSIPSSSLGGRRRRCGNLGAQLTPLAPSHTPEALRISWPD